jgi:hypothetical protein
LPPTPSATCTCPGPILCCNEIVDSESADGQAILSGLGVTITGSHIPLGKGCLENMVCPPGIPCVSAGCVLRWYRDIHHTISHAITAAHCLHKSSLLFRVFEAYVLS